MSPVEALTQIRALHGPGKHVQDPQLGRSIACQHCHKTWPCETRRLVDAVSVDATPAQGIDGVVLTREEAALARRAVVYYDVHAKLGRPDEILALAARLEASS